MHAGGGQLLQGWLSIQGRANHLGMQRLPTCFFVTAIPQKRLKRLKMDRQESSRKGRGHGRLDNETVTILNQIL